MPKLACKRPVECRAKRLRSNQCAARALQCVLAYASPPPVVPARTEMPWDSSHSPSLPTTSAGHPRPVPVSGHWQSSLHSRGSADFVVHPGISPCSESAFYLPQLNEVRVLHIQTLSSIFISRARPREKLSPRLPSSLHCFVSFLLFPYLFPSSWEARDEVGDCDKVVSMSLLNRYLDGAYITWLSSAITCCGPQLEETHGRGKLRPSKAIFMSNEYRRREADDNPPPSTPSHSPTNTRIPTQQVLIARMDVQD